jgi:hypothetical protein
MIYEPGLTTSSLQRDGKWLMPNGGSFRGALQIQKPG